MFYLFIEVYEVYFVSPSQRTWQNEEMENIRNKRKRHCSTIRQL